MLLKCVETGESKHLTKGKLYELSSFNLYYICVRCDAGHLQNYPHTYFVKAGLLDKLISKFKNR